MVWDVRVGYAGYPTNKSILLVSHVDCTYSTYQWDRPVVRVPGATMVATLIEQPTTRETHRRCGGAATTVCEAMGSTSFPTQKAFKTSAGGVSRSGQAIIWIIIVRVSRRSYVRGRVVDRAINRFNPPDGITTTTTYYMRRGLVAPCCPMPLGSATPNFNNVLFALLPC